MRHEIAKAACSLRDNDGSSKATRTESLVTKEGGWCLSSRNTTKVSLQHGQTYNLPLHHVKADHGMVEALLKLDSREGGRASFNDFGAGVGQYGHALLSRRPEIRWRGYDGAGNIEQFTSGFIDWFDLSLPLSLPRSDWVISLEVGEHVPHSLEEMVVRNLHAHNCRGIILSWAALGQGGYFHINVCASLDRLARAHPLLIVLTPTEIPMRPSTRLQNHGQEYLTSVFVALGYWRNEELTTSMRQDAHRPWFRSNLMVFERRSPLSCSKHDVEGQAR